MSDLLHWARRPVVLALLLAVLGCAEGYSSAESSAKTEPSNAPSATSEMTAPAREDARFVATEEEGVKAWRLSGSTAPVTVNLQNRGSKPVILKAVNMLPGEHGFAIDTMKVKEVLQPGEEKTITVPMDNIDPSVPQHRVYCQLHPKHVAATVLTVAQDQSQKTDRVKGPSSPPQSGEVSSRVPGTPEGQPGESEGPRVIREQSQEQRTLESTSSDVQAPGSTAAKACEGFPGFDRGCPGTGK
jgi:hypothetical protein